MDLFKFLQSFEKVCSCECSEKTQRKCVTLCKAIFVRLLLISHNLLAVWRVTVAYNNDTYWLLALGVILIAWEGQYTILKNDGIEWKWVCPCFFFYLGTTLPSVWLLELSQMNKYLNSNDVIPPSGNSSVAAGDNNVTILSPADTGDLSMSDNAWVVAIEETLVYFIVIGRWLLPRGEVSREALSDLLLDYLAMASDIMELFGLFDQDEIRGNKKVTYAILSVWSISFIQFIPVVFYKRVYRTITPAHKGNRTGFMNACGDGFVEIFATCMAILLQDGPFLILRLCIISYLNIITYSLMFFVVKNIIVILLLVYKLIILCIKMPCCFKEEGEIESVISVDLNIPVKLDPPVKPKPPVDNIDSQNNLDDEIYKDMSVFY